MNVILNTIKCAICREIIESPVILPCSCNICKKHVSSQNEDDIRCEKCGVEHQIPTNGFQANNVLQEIIEAEIAKLDFGSFYKEAKKSCESVEEALIEFEVLLKDPHFYTHERISELKNSVQIKGEELKLIIDQEMKKLLDRLEEFERQSKDYLSSDELDIETKKLESELKFVQSNLHSWFKSFNKIKLDEENWKSIIEKSHQKLKCITEESENFKNKLLLNKFEKNQKDVNWFKNLKIDPIFKCVSIKSDFPESTIITESLSQMFEDILKKKDLNGRNRSLLYRGSRDGFRASDFHSHCDNKPNTLTIVKSTSENIFGGFTSAEWKSSATKTYEFDNNSFLFSLVNKEKRPLIFEKHSNDRYSICSYKECGPIFGSCDILIFDSLKKQMCCSYLGCSYIHPEYPYGSERTKKILAGSFNFLVKEIEVFQLQE